MRILSIIALALTPVIRVQAQPLSALPRDIPRLIMTDAPLGSSTSNCPACGPSHSPGIILPWQNDARPVSVMPALAVPLLRDGQAVTSRLLTQQPSASAFQEIEANGKIVRAAVDEAGPALAESVRRGRWNGENTTLDHACCGDAAPKLALILRHMGLPIDVVEAEMHYYALWHMPDNDLFVDPTIRQFFGGPSAPASVPQIFVGSEAALNAVFLRHHQAKSTLFNVDRIYFRSARTRNEKIAELQRQAAPRPDLNPLVRFIAARRDGAD